MLDTHVQRLNNAEGKYQLPINLAALIVENTPVTLDWLYFGRKGGLPVDLVKAIEAVEQAEKMRLPLRAKFPRKSKMAGGWDPGMGPVGGF
jgi:hypothetical protein